jgi:protein ImuA
MSSSGQPSPSPLSAVRQMVSREPASRETVLAGLRARIRTLEQGAPAGAGSATVSLGAALDQALPWGGLPPAGLHEILGEPGPGGLSPATGFAAWLAARIAGPAGFILWCRPAGAEARLYGPGLAAVGLDAGRLLLVAARSPAGLLWAAEEGLRSQALAAVVVEGAAPDLTAQRRLQLAAQAGGAAALLLRAQPVKAAETRASAPSGASAQMPTHAGAQAALTRWRISAAPSDATAETVADAPAGPPLRSAAPRPLTGGAASAAAAPGARWLISLVRCRGGSAAAWLADAPSAAPSWTETWTETWAACPLPRTEVQQASRGGTPAPGVVTRQAPREGTKEDIRGHLDRFSPPPGGCQDSAAAPAGLCRPMAGPDAARPGLTPPALTASVRATPVRATLARTRHVSSPAPVVASLPPAGDLRLVARVRHRPGGTAAGTRNAPDALAAG